MTTSTRTTLLTGAAFTLADLALSPLAPASADGLEVSEAQDLDHGVDLRSVALRHTTDNIVVTTTHTDLVQSYRSGSSGAVFLDTDPSDTGPEYDTDQVRMRISREALGSPEEVRVAVRVAGTRPNGKDTRVDWLGAT